MALINEKMTEIWSTCNEPSLYYNKVWTWFQNGDLSSEMWDIFVMACLKSLMEKNKDMLDRLKNCWYNNNRKRGKKLWEKLFTR